MSIHTNTLQSGQADAAETFPVTWQEPDDAGHFWSQGRMHGPDPIFPLHFSMQEATYAPGFTAALRRYQLPLEEVRVRRINAYLYQSMVPSTGTPQEMAARGQRAQEQLRHTIARLGERWQDEWLPAIKAHLSFWETFALSEASAASLLAHLEETLERRRDLWDIHFQVVLPAMVAVSLFDDFYTDLFPDQDRFAAYDLLQGFENKALERDRWLWRLSRRALETAAVRDAFLAGAATEIEPLLQQSEAGRVFLAEFDNLVAEFGAAWSDDATTPLAIIAEYVRQPERNLEEELAAVVQRRQEGIARAQQAMSNFPQAVRQQFDFLLQAAQQGNVLHEDHAYWIDQRAAAGVNRVLAACGRQLAAAGAIEQPEDVRYLTVADLRDALQAPGISHRGLVQERQAEMTRFAASSPPLALGTPPAGPPPDNPISRMITRFLGAPPPPPDSADTIPGNAGSPGRASGRVRLVHTLAEAGELQSGEILVAITTSPAWTPLFATAAAVVTDTGGILSHAASVAREYGIPAVVGAVGATERLRTGQQVEVDGTAGTVRILS